MIIGNLIAKAVVAIIITTYQFTKAFLIKICELFTTRSGRMRLLCLYVPIAILIMVLLNETTVKYIENYMYKILEILKIDNSFVDNNVSIPFPKNVVFWFLMLVPIYVLFIPSFILSIKSTNKLMRIIGITLPIIIYLSFSFFTEYMLQSFIVVILIIVLFIFYLTIDYKKRIREGSYKSTTVFKETISQHNFVTCFFGVINAIFIVVMIGAAIYYGIAVLLEKNDNVAGTLGLIVPILVIIVGVSVIYKLTRKSSDNYDYDSKDYWYVYKQILINIAFFFRNLSIMI